MGDAYTPGLTVTGSTLVRKTRRLPLPGKVLVDVNDEVKADQVVARTELPGRVHLINFANKLGVLPIEVEADLKVKPGDSIREGQLLAEHRSFFGLLKTGIHSPITGTFESVSKVTGQTVLREPPSPVEVKAYIDGKVVEIIESEGVIVEAEAAMVQGIFGLSGEVFAPLCVISTKPGELIDTQDLGKNHKDKIIVGSGRATLEALRKAIDIGVAGVVVGGFAYHDIRDLLGYDVGVAVTGTEELGTTLVVTEGFGDIAMAQATFELLRAHDGDDASISGATQIRAGVIRPEVIITRAAAAGKADAVAAPSPAGGPYLDAAPAPSGLEIGAPVRCIRSPYFGKIGKVSDLPIELKEMPSETLVRVLEVELDGGDRVVVPRANVEVIEG